MALHASRNLPVKQNRFIRLSVIEGRSSTMDPSLYTALFLSCFFVPIAIFSVVALFARAPLPRSSTPRSSDLDEYLISSRDVGQADFVNSTAAYMLQVSTTFYFIFWGYNYGFSNFWYLCSWGLGIYIFSRFAPKLIEIGDLYETLPSFLAGGGFTALRYVSSLVTMVAFLAMFYVESYFCVDYIATLANPASNQPATPIWWFFFLILTLLAVTYSIFGGLRRVIITDRWQISFAYACISLIFAYLLPSSFSVSPLSASVLAAMMIALFGSLFWMNRGNRNRPLIRGSLLLGLAILVVTTLLSLHRLNSFARGPFLIAGPFRQINEKWGWVALLGFTIVNILWQFCDNSNYQRIASLHANDDPSKRARELQKLIMRLIVVSPLTWGLGILLGIAIRTAGVPVPQSGSEYIALLLFLKHAALAGSPFAVLAILAFSAALTSIMMETVDSALMALTQTLMRDTLDSHDLPLSRICVVAGCAYTSVIVLAIIHRGFSQASILTVMAAAYSVLIVLALPAIFRLKRMFVSDRWVIAGVVSGVLLTGLATFGPVSSLPSNIQIALPLYAGPVGSAVPMIVGLLMRRGSGHSHNG
jgi:Na+/proline symporter